MKKQDSSFKVGFRPGGNQSFGSAARHGFVSSAKMSDFPAIEAEYAKYKRELKPDEEESEPQGEVEDDETEDDQ